MISELKLSLNIYLQLVRNQNLIKTISNPQKIPMGKSSGKIRKLKFQQTILIMTLIRN